MTNIARSVDQTFLFITIISLVLLGLVTFFMLYFAFRYSRKRNPEVQEVEGSLWIEITWTVIPTILVLFMFYWGYEGFRMMRKAPEGAMEVKVTARMWTWDFQYSSGRHSDELMLPVGQPVKLRLNSLDVLHSLFIPAFRVKEDAVPGQETMLWFIPEQEGVFDLFCTEYCGVGHSGMLTKVRVLSEADYDKWLSSTGVSSVVAEKTLALMKSKGCLSCHSTDGSRKVGPTFKGIFGRKGIVITEGAEREVIADESYIMRSISEPKADIAKGYPPVMPTIKLTDKEIRTIVDYFEDSGGKAETPGDAGMEVARKKGCLGCHSTDGTRKIGPTFKGIFGRKGIVITDGAERQITSDEVYIRRSITEPKADIAKGYPPVMPTIKLSKDEIESIIIFLKGLEEK